MKGSVTSQKSIGARRGVLAVATVAALVLAACGGDDDDAADSSTTTLAPAVTTTLAPAVTTTLAPATTTTLATPLDLVTEGASVVVANSSGIDGAATRMSDQLEVEGFEMGEPTNGSEGQLEITKIYFDPANEDAQPVAESVRLVLGGGDIELFEMGVPAPVESGDIGDATVLVSMGNDTADKTLAELQGVVVVDTSTDEGTGDDGTGDEDTGDDGTGDESTGDESTGDEGTGDEG